MVQKEKLITDAYEILKEVENQKINSPISFNLLDIGNISEKENIISSFLTYLLDNKKGSQRNNFDTLFLNIIKRKLPKLRGSKIFKIEREKTITNGRRIDIFIQTDFNEIIIIENKIWADDQLNQLKDYYNWSIQSFPDVNNFLIYLSPFGHNPSIESIPKDLLIKLTNQKQYTALSYETDILELLATIEDDLKDNEVYLKSGLIQLKDSIAGFCDEREKDKLKDKLLMNKIFTSYQDINDETLHLKEIADIIKAEVEIITILKFLDTLVDELKQNHKLNNVFYTHKQKRYSISQKDNFYNAIEETPEYVGIEISLEHENLGIGLEFSDLGVNTTCTFGLMSHIDSNKNSLQKYKQKSNISNKLKLDFDNTIKSDNWWWEYVDFTPKSWFQKSLFHQIDWQQKNGSLALYVANNWFVPIIEEFKK